MPVHRIHIFPLNLLLPVLLSPDRLSVMKSTLNVFCGTDDFYYYNSKADCVRMIEEEVKKMQTSDIRILAMVALGGAIGSVLRYGMSGLLTRGDFPWGTFAVNLIGTFLLSLIFFLFIGKGYMPPDLRAFLFIGLFGGFTTFSTFGLETISLLRESHLWLAAINVFMNAGLCIVGAFIGGTIGTLIGGS